MPPSPPAQTPVNFLKGGAAAMFSAQCVKALNQAGYDQNDFGSYDHVSDRIKAAKDKKKAWADATPAQRRAQNLQEPTPHDDYLAGPYKRGQDPEFPDACQSGHLVPNSVYQDEGKRGNPARTRTALRDTT